MMRGTATSRDRRDGSASDGLTPQLVVGIDTGGTHTDAVLLDYRSRRLRGAAKTLTTRDDLALGVVEALRRLPIEEPADVELVGISSTLATNSIAEGRVRRVGLLLVGYDQELIERCQLAPRLWTPDFAFFRGGLDSSGAEREPVDLDGIVAWVRRHGSAFDALAVSGYFSPLDPSQELAAREAIGEVCSLPVVLGHELSTRLDSIRRAATAALNASLVAVMGEFVQAVRAALAALRIEAPLMIVKGDGSLVPYAEAVRKPVDTIVSGPAASAVGGQFFAGLERALIVDMGGTTTDICLLDEGRVTVSDRGAKVGDVETAVPAAQVTTVCLGCDSRIRVVAGEAPTIGPERVVPLCRLAKAVPRVAEELGAVERRLPSARRETDLIYWQLGRPVGPADPVLRDERQRRLVALLGEGPASMTRIGRELGVHHEVQLDPAHLLAHGIVEVAALTPTDLLHRLGRLDRWDQAAARRAVDLSAAFAGQGAERFAEELIDELVRQVAERVVVFLARRQGAHELADQVDEGWGRFLLQQGLSGGGSHLAVRLRCPFPIIGIGAPAGALLREVAARLDAPFELPAEHAVANAAGAVAGSVVVGKEAIVYRQALGDRQSYRVQVDGRTESFAEVEPARRFARRQVAEAALQAAVRAGAAEPVVAVEHRSDGALERLVARAMGGPSLADRAGRAGRTAPGRSAVRSSAAGRRPASEPARRH